MSRAAAILPFFRGDTAHARELAGEWVALARPTGDPYEIAQALTMLGAAQGADGDFDLARTTNEEAVRVARDAAIPSALSIALSILAASSPIDESDRILALIDEAIEVGTQIGDRIAVRAGISNKGWVAAYRGDYTLALHAAVESAKGFLQDGDLGSGTPVIAVAAVALTHLGHPEPAAILDGFAKHSSFPMGEWATQLFSDAETAMIAQLGQPEFDNLRAQGAAITLGDAYTYLINIAQTQAPMA